MGYHTHVRSMFFGRFRIFRPDIRYQSIIRQMSLIIIVFVVYSQKIILMPQIMVISLQLEFQLYHSHFPTRYEVRRKNSNTDGEQIDEDDMRKENGELRVPMAHTDNIYNNVAMKIIN